MGLFWEQLENVHITMPLRQLIDLTLRMVADLNRNLEVEVYKCLTSGCYYYIPAVCS